MSLHEAVERESVAAVKNIIHKNPAAVNEKDKFGQTPLHLAVQKLGAEAVVEALLESKKVQVNITDDVGWTPLHCSCYNGNFPVCLLLLQQKGIETKRLNDSANSALHYIVRHSPKESQAKDYLEILSGIVRKGAVVDLKNKNHETALFYACLAGNAKAVKFLIDEGADVNALNRAKETPLFFSVTAKSATVAALLLNHGADPLIESDKGFTAIDEANRLKLASLVDLMTKASERSANEVSAPVLESKRRIGLDLIRTTSEVLKTKPMAKVDSTRSIKPTRKTTIATIQPSSILQYFVLMSSLEIPKQKKTGSAEVVNFVSSVESFLLGVFSYYTQPTITNMSILSRFDNAIPVSWSRIFYERMRQAEDVLKKPILTKMRNTIHAYLRYADPASKPCLYAKSLVDFLVTHKTDPDSSLVGLELQPEFAYSLPKELEDILLNYIKLDNKKDDKEYGPFRAVEKDKYDCRTPQPVLANSIKKWAETPDKTKLETDISYLASSLRLEDELMKIWGDTKLGKGDIVLLSSEPTVMHKTKHIHRKRTASAKRSNSNRNSTRVYEKDILLQSLKLKVDEDDEDIALGMEENIQNMDPNKQEATVGAKSVLNTSTRESELELRFARFSGLMCPETVGLWLTPSEEFIVRVSKLRILPLSVEIREKLIGVAGMQQLVVDTARDFHRTLIRHARERLFSVLEQQQGMDIVQFRRWVSFEIELADTNKLKDAKKRLELFLGSVPDEFAKKLSEEIDTMRATFSKNFDVNTTFLPTRRQNMRNLTTIDVKEVIRSCLQRFIQYCDSALEYIKLERESILSGARKQQLTEWWLDLIDNENEKFLNIHGYDPTAVPDDYIEQPPSDIQKVKENLRIVQACLDPNSYLSSDINDQMESLKGIIYPRIDCFMKDTLIVLAQYFDIFEEGFTFEKARELLVLKKATLTEAGVKSGEEKLGSPPLSPRSVANSPTFSTSPRSVEESESPSLSPPPSHATFSPQSSETDSNTTDKEKAQDISTDPRGNFLRMKSVDSIMEAQESLSSADKKVMKRLSSSCENVPIEVSQGEKAEQLHSYDNDGRISEDDGPENELVLQSPEVDTDLVSSPSQDSNKDTPMHDVISNPSNSPLLAESAVLQKAEEVIPSKQLRTMQAEITRVEDLLKDITYLETIIGLEKAPKTGGNFSENLNIVPISGLILGKFFRVENELKTVLEVWDRSSWDKKSSEEVPVSPSTSPQESSAGSSIGLEENAGGSNESAADAAKKERSASGTLQKEESSNLGFLKKKLWEDSLFPKTRIRSGSLAGVFRLPADSNKSKAGGPVQTEENENLDKPEKSTDSTDSIIIDDSEITLPEKSFGMESRSEKTICDADTTRINVESKDDSVLTEDIDLFISPRSNFRRKQSEDPTMDKRKTMALAIDNVDGDTLKNPVPDDGLDGTSSPCIRTRKPMAMLEAPISKGPSQHLLEKKSESFPEIARNKERDALKLSNWSSVRKGSAASALPSATISLPSTPDLNDETPLSPLESNLDQERDRAISPLSLKRELLIGTRRPSLCSIDQLPSNLKEISEAESTKIAANTEEGWNFLKRSNPIDLPSPRKEPTSPKYEPKHEPKMAHSVSIESDITASVTGSYGVSPHRFSGLSDCDPRASIEEADPLGALSTSPHVLLSRAVEERASKPEHKTTSPLSSPRSHPISPRSPRGEECGSPSIKGSLMKLIRSEKKKT